MKEPQFTEFPPEEYELRVTRARALMEEEGLDALLLTQMENVRYLAGYLSLLWISKFRPLLALVPETGCEILTNRLSKDLWIAE